MSQVNTIVKGFQTLQGTVQYDYESLKNKPDIEGKIQTALEEYKVDVDTTLKNAGEAADAKATGEKIAQAISNANTYTDEQLGSFKVNVDTTLKKEGQAADAAATGAAITNILTEAKVYTDEQLSNYKINVDSEIDDSSENPVQNKVIAAEIADLNILANTALENATTAQATADENAEKLLTFKYGLTKLPSIRTWRDVAYGDGKFIAVAEQSDVAAYSTDGITWVEVSLPSTANWSSITYGNGMFVAVTRASKTAAYSTDGIHWEPSELPSSTPWTKVVYGNDIFVAIAYYSAIAAYSTDGIVWQKTTLTVSNMWNDLAFGNGVFVAVASNSNTINYSTDGINWNPTTLDSSVNLQTVTYGNGKFVAMIYGSIKALYSVDGISWEETKLPYSGGWQAVTYANDRFVCVAAHNEIVVYSTDGINWEESTLPNNDYWIAIEYGNGKFVAITRNNDIAAYSIDGVTWKRDYANFIQNEVDITEDIKTLLLEEATREEIVQANWNQNDESAADYVKNRTHYEEMLLEGEFYNGRPSYVGGSGYDDLPYFYSLPDIETDQLYPLKQFSLKVNHLLYGEGEREILANTRYKTTSGPARTFMITVQSVNTGAKYLLSIVIYCSVSSGENIIMSDLVMANTIPEKYIPPTIVRTDITNNLQAQIDNLTPEQIGAHPNTWLPTPEQIGAAPAGYGLGTTAKFVDSWDNALGNGFYYSNVGGPVSGDFYGIVHSYDNSGNWVIQNVWSSYPGGSNTCAVRRKQAGTWLDWEWENPPMALGVEYRTTERWNSKVVYTMLDAIGSLPNTSHKVWEHGLGATKIIRYSGTTTASGAAIPYHYEGKEINLACDRTHVVLSTNFDAAYLGSYYVQLWYTKD